MCVGDGACMYMHHEWTYSWPVWILFVCNVQQGQYTKVETERTQYRSVTGCSSSTHRRLPSCTQEDTCMRQSAYSRKFWVYQHHRFRVYQNPRLVSFLWTRQDLRREEANGARVNHPAESQQRYHCGQRVPFDSARPTH